MRSARVILATWQPVIDEQHDAALMRSASAASHGARPGYFRLITVGQRRAEIRFDAAHRFAQGRGGRAPRPLESPEIHGDAQGIDLARRGSQSAPPRSASSTSLATMTPLNGSGSVSSQSDALEQRGDGDAASVCRCRSRRSALTSRIQYSAGSASRRSSSASIVAAIAPVPAPSSSTTACRRFNCRSTSAHCTRKAAAEDRRDFRRRDEIARAPEFAGTGAVIAEAQARTGRAS